MTDEHLTTSTRDRGVLLDHFVAWLRTATADDRAAAGLARPFAHLQIDVIRKA